MVTFSDRCKSTVRNGNNGVAAVHTESDSLDTPINTNILNTVSYQSGYRLNASGKATERVGRIIIDFIHAPTSRRLYFQNITTISGDYGRLVAYYTSDNEDTVLNSYLIADNNKNAQLGEGGTSKFFLTNDSSVQYARFCFVGIDAASIITVNEPLNCSLFTGFSGPA